MSLNNILKHIRDEVTVVFWHFGVKEFKREKERNK